PPSNRTGPRPRTFPQQNPTSQSYKTTSPGPWRVPRSTVYGHFDKTKTVPRQSKKKSAAKS
ncbi:hypothetical protein ACFYMK_37360, partial [Streptomyces sp. NPDC007355]